MAPRKPSLTKANMGRARRVLLTIARLLDKNKIVYHLEGGTLLGIVRDKDLLPWDHDVDISIPASAVPNFLKLRFALLCRGYKLSVRRSTIEAGPIKRGDYSIFKIKPLAGYLLHWLIPSHHDKFIVLDVFVKTNDSKHTYWQAKRKVMRVEKEFYESFETVSYHSQLLKVPQRFRDYLTQKYGDWSKPVKDWECSRDEKTIITIVN